MPASPDIPSCRQCRYLLTGLPKGPCPECGTLFDPDHPTTLGSPSRAYPVAAYAPHRVINIVYALVVVPLFLAMCSPNGMFADGWAGVWTLLVFGTAALWTLWVFSHLVGRTVLLFQRQRQPRWRWNWLAIPATLALCITVQQSCIIWHLCWIIARPAFADAVQSGSQPGWIGGFYVTEIRRDPSGVVYFELGPPDQWYSDGPPHHLRPSGSRSRIQPLVPNVRVHGTLAGPHHVQRRSRRPLASMG